MSRDRLIFDGLPESKIESITMKNVEISFAKEAEMGVPIMSKWCGTMQ